MRLSTLGRLSAAAVIVAALVAVPAMPAFAAGEVELSSDGIVFSDNIASPLFRDLGRIVPGDGRVERFFVRNSGTEPGLLRITLHDVVVSDETFVRALTVTASTYGNSGVPTPISPVNQCGVLNEVQRVEVGEIVAVDTLLELGDVEGREGQGASASFSIRVSLSAVEVAPPPAKCDGPGVTIPGIAPPADTVPGGTPPAPSSGTNGVGADDTTTEGAALQPPRHDVAWASARGIHPNTYRLLEEYLVLVLLLSAFVVGPGSFLLLAWWRRRREGSEGDVHKEMPTSLGDTDAVP